MVLVLSTVLLHAMFVLYKSFSDDQEAEEDATDGWDWRSSLDVPTTLAIVMTFGSMLLVLHAWGSGAVEDEREELEDKARLYGILMLSAGALFGFLSSVTLAKMLIFRPCSTCGYD